MAQNRRHFLGSIAAAGTLTGVSGTAMSDASPAGGNMADAPFNPVVQAGKIDLSPAQWIWFPSERTLPNTFVLFRREFMLEALPERAHGWITADSRYRLTVNGQYVQRGVAPCDPRWVDVDPVDIGRLLRLGKNCLGIEVFYFGTGESMWVAGKPGLLFSLELDFGAGRKEQILSDKSWQCYIDRGHRPGQYRRWLLRGLQEDFDARLHPHGWDQPDYASGPDWTPAMLLENRADKPSLCSRYEDSLWLRSATDPDSLWLRRRSLALLDEKFVLVKRLQESARVHWSREPEDWFEFRTPNSFQMERTPVATGAPGQWILPATERRTGVIATFELEEELVGYPYFTIDAAAGTVIEVSCQELHDPSVTAWLDTHWFKWMRFTCREGANRFEACDHDAVRWMQLHIHNASRPVVLSDVGVRRRVYPWPNQARIRCAEAPLQRLFDASINTLCNSAQETSNDPGREREQYCGCGALQLQGVRYAFGEYRMPQRALRTYSEGSTLEGYFLDPWPAFEVLTYLGHREIGTTVFGSQIDEGVTFALNCWNHLLESGDLESMREIYPRLIRLAHFLEGAIGPDRLLPVEHVGGETLNVWLDDDAYPWGKPARWRQCAFNLHVAAVLKGALAPMAEAFSQSKESARLRRVAKSLEAATVKRFWSNEWQIFVDNLPWLQEDDGPRLSDRVLATAILYEQCPGGDIEAATRALVERPKEMALSYPMNAVWRYWALGRVGRGDVIVKELRSRWATMRAVIENNSLPEVWNHQPDKRDEGNYFQVTPLNALFTDVAGIRPLALGFSRCQIRPQLGDLGQIELTAWTPHGPIHLDATPERAGHTVKLRLPAGCEGELVLTEDVPCRLPALGGAIQAGLRRYGLRAGTEQTFRTSRE